MQLSKTQVQVLQDLDQGSILHFMAYMGRFNLNPYWFVSQTMRPVRCSTVEKLKRHGFVQVTKRDPFGSKTTAGITESGKVFMEMQRAALALLAGKKGT